MGWSLAHQISILSTNLSTYIVGKKYIPNSLVSLSRCARYISMVVSQLQFEKRSSGEKSSTTSSRTTIPNITITILININLNLILFNILLINILLLLFSTVIIIILTNNNNGSNIITMFMYTCVHVWV
jgi:hypothetical protein